MANQELKVLRIENCELPKLQVMAIDTYLIQNAGLKELRLKNVGLTQDLLKLLGGTIETSKSLLRLDLSVNALKNGGAKELAKIICRNKSLLGIDIT
jgi:Ran GTPase-activating protein (RanGAP) involved in mRNA processing and transport